MPEVYDKPGAERSEPVPSSQNTKPQLPGSETKPAKKPAPDRDELKNAEENASASRVAGTSRSSANDGEVSGFASRSSSTSSFYNPKNSQQQRSATSFIKKHKVLAGALGGFLLLMIILIFLLLSLLKIPNLAAHITAYQFARVARNASEHTSAIESEDVAVSTVDDTVFNSLKTQFSDIKDGTWGSMWDKINSYRPDKIVENLQQQGTLDFQYEPRFSALGMDFGKKLTAVVINGEEIPYGSSLWKSLFRPVASFQDSVAFTTQVNTALASAMEGRSVLVRGAVAKSIRNLLDIRLQWWNPKTYPPGEDAADAEAQAEKDAFTAIEDPKVAQGEIPDIQNAAEKAQAEVTDCVENNAACLASEVENFGAAPADAVNTIKSVSFNDATKTAIGFINPLYAVAMPACLIYDGSLQSQGAQQTVDSNNAELQRSYYAVATSADQQKNGYNTTAAAVGSMNWKLGDISQSIPEQRAMGNTVDTTTAPSPQAGANGSVSNGNIFSALGVPFASWISAVLSASISIPFLGTVTTCSAITNIYSGIALGLLNLGVAAITAGQEEEAATALAGVVTNFLDETFSLDTAKQLGLTIAGVTAATLLAQIIVASKSAITNSGLATGPAFDNAADEGGNLNANEIGRSFYGRPLTNAEVAQSANEDQNFANGELAAGKSPFERYFAISNPDSLVSKMGWDLRSHLKLSSFSSLFNSISKIFNPASWFGSALNFGHANVLAANGADTQNYGIVQWGWSDAEENLIKNDPSYQPLDNQYILSQNSAAEYAIAQKYNKCFGYDAPASAADLNASAMTPVANESMGTLLTNTTDIQRAANGDITGGDCSPTNLGIDSPDPLAVNNTPDPLSKTVSNGHDLIFRYRLEMNYELTMDQLQGVQTPTATTTASSGSSSSTPASPTGTGSNTPGGIWMWDATTGTVDPNSASKISSFLNYGLSGGAYFTAAVARVNAPAGTTSYNVQTQEAVSPVSAPIPLGTKPGSTDDQSLTVQDLSTGIEYDFGNANYDTSTGKISGAYGVATVQPGDAYETGPGGNSADAAKFPLLRGLITPADVASGVINHPLVFSMPNVGPAPNPYPSAPGTEGYPGNTGLPLGTWLRLNPSVNVASLGLSKFEAMIAVALQKYGMFCRDIGYYDLSIIGTDQVNQGGNAVDWPAVGVSLPNTIPAGQWAAGTPYATRLSSNFPWSSMQVLEPPAQ